MLISSRTNRSTRTTLVSTRNKHPITPSRASRAIAGCWTANVDRGVESHLVDAHVFSLTILFSFSPYPFSTVLCPSMIHGLTNITIVVTSDVIVLEDLGDAIADARDQKKWTQIGGRG